MTAWVGGHKNELGKKNSVTIEWTVPEGIPGDTLEIKIAPITTGMGASDNAIHFIYEYKEGSTTTTPPPTPTPTPAPTPTPTPPPTPTPAPTPTPDKNVTTVQILQPGPEDGKDVRVYSYTYRNWDNANWGAIPGLEVGYKGTDCINRIYIEFDLSSLPSDREIAKAMLSLYNTNQECEGFDYAVYRVTEPWAEGEGTYHSGEVEPTAPEPWITWNRQPSFDSTQAYATESIAQGSAPRWINLDVTELVENWYEGSWPNYGMVLKGVAESDSFKVRYCGFPSSETEAAELRPKLVVTFSGGGQPAKECEGDEPYLYVEDRVMGKGKTLEIPIIMCNAEDLANMDIDWSYNASVLKLIDVTKGSLNEKALFDWNEVSPGKLKIAFASAKGVTGSGSIAVMKFEVIGNTGDTSTLTGTVTTASKTDGTEISVSVNPGEFTVGTSQIKGDCDGDGELTVKDALAVIQMSVVKMAVDMCCDYNGDGKVDTSDAREILKAIGADQ